MSRGSLIPSSTAIGLPGSSRIWLSWLNARFSSRLDPTSGGMSLAPHACFGSRTFGKMTNGMNPYGFDSRSASSSPRHRSKTSGVQCAVIVVVAVLPSVAGSAY
jgi:hypothetical protein